jgi:hypothetical protein
MCVITGDFPGIFPSQFIPAAGNDLEEKLMNETWLLELMMSASHDDWMVVQMNVRSRCWMSQPNEMMSVGSCCWTDLISPNGLIVREILAWFPMVLTASRVNKTWCEPLVTMQRGKSMLGRCADSTKHLCFWLGLRGVFRFGLYLDFGGKPYPFHRLKSLDLFQKIQFSWHSVIKNSKKNATRAEYSHQFSADFPVFPPTSSSPLLQIHLAKDQQQKASAWRVTKSRKLNKNSGLWFYDDVLYSLVKSLLHFKTIKYKIYWYMRRSIKAHFCAYLISMRDDV